MSNPYHVKSGPHGGEFTHGPDSAKAKETEKRHKPEYSGITTPLDPSHQHFAIYVDHGFGTRRLGNDPTATIGGEVNERCAQSLEAGWLAVSDE